MTASGTAPLLERHILLKREGKRRFVVGWEHGWVVKAGCWGMFNLPRCELM